MTHKSVHPVPSPSSSAPVVTFRALALTLMLTANAMPLMAQIPEKFENLQVFPKDISQGELVAAMRGFATGLGVRCQHCHLGEEGRPLSEFDFVSDEKPTKEIARVMMRMTREINEGFLPKVGRKPPQRLEVQCVTCHHGQNRPESLEHRLAAKIARSGVEEAVTDYHQLREGYLGRDTFDFSDRPLSRLAATLAGEEKADAARVFLELNLEFHPESIRSLVQLADVYSGGGEKQRAIENLRKALEIEPKNSWVQRKLESLISQE